MSLFKGEEIKHIYAVLRRLETRADATDTDRRRIKDNADKQGGAIIDLECKVNKLLEGKKDGKKHKH